MRRLTSVALVAVLAAATTPALAAKKKKKPAAEATETKSEPKAEPAPAEPAPPAKPAEPAPSPEATAAPTTTEAAPEPAAEKEEAPPPKTKAAHADKGGVDFAINVGGGSPTGDSGKVFDMGPFLQFSLGGKVHPRVTIAGQLSGSYLLFANNPSGVDQTAGYVGLGLAGLFDVLPEHQVKEHIDVLVGPTVGFWGLFVNQDDHVEALSSQAYGIYAGFELGVLYKVSPKFAIGPWFEWSKLYYMKACAKLGENESICEKPDVSDGFYSITASMAF